MFRLLFPGWKWTAAFLLLAAMPVIYLAEPGVSVGKDMSGREDAYLALLVFLVLLWSLVAMKRWSSCRYTLSIPENVTMMLIMGIVCSTLAGFADFNLYRLHNDQYLIDSEYSKLLLAKERPYNKAKLESLVKDLQVWKYFADALKSPSILMAAVLDRTADADDGNARGHDQIVLDSPSMTVIYSATYVWARGPGDPAPHREYTRHLKFSNNKSGVYRTIDTSVVENAACNQQVWNEVGVHDSVKIALSTEVACRVSSDERDIQNLEDRSLQMSVDSSAYPPSYAFIHEWVMDFCGSRPMLIRPIGTQSRLLSVVFGFVKLYFFYVVLSIVIPSLTRSDVVGRSEPGRDSS